MKNYTDMTPLARFNELDALARQFFGTERWKSLFCRRYDRTPQTLTAWTNKGAPVWALVAMRDALDRKKLRAAVRNIEAVQIDG